MSSGPAPISLVTLIAAFLLHTTVLSGAGVAAQVWLRGAFRGEISRAQALLIGVLAPTLLGYAAFWLYFLHPLAGRIFSWVTITTVAATLGREISRGAASRVVVNTRLLLLTLVAGIFYLAALAMFPGPKFTNTASERFVAHMPGDNEIPRIVAERLYIGMSPKKIGGDWLSSDRPPLQSGVALIAAPLLTLAKVDLDLICGSAGVWFQLLWIPALWIFLRWLGLHEHEAHAATAALAFTGFLLFHSVFVWPKLGGAALVLIGFVMLFWDDAESGLGSVRVRFALAGTLLALGMLAHGGVFFSLLALVPLALRGCVRSPAAALGAAAMFFALTLPWSAYQRFYEPPGNRLVKWHIAGAIAPDDRPVLTALRDNYREVGWAKAWEARRANFLMLFYGEWRDLLTPRGGEIGLWRRGNEAPWTFRSAAIWIFGLAALPWLGWRQWRKRDGCRGSPRRHALAAAWLGLTLLVWVALLFFRKQAVVHQGSYVTQLLFLGLLATWLVLWNRWVFALVAGMQAWIFLLTWLAPSKGLAWPASVGAGMTCIAFAALIAGIAGSHLFSARSTAPDAGSAQELPPRRLTAELRAWWTAPRLTWWFLLGVAGLLFLRKPHALHTPQLYAEDGSIFLAFNDLLGLRAFLEPYMGYLHVLPRLVAWVASHTLDPAWWPAFYNGVSFLIWVAVIARTFSPRLPLPGKPWLALAFIIGPQTGEVLFNITNLQWVTALLLVQQAVIVPPATWRHRIGDGLLVVLVGLTGPFVIALGPVLAWRWWRSRTRHNTALLLVAVACAAVQAWFLWRTGPKFEFPPFALGRFLEILGQRLLIWPLLGDTLAIRLSSALVGVVGLAPVVALLAWALRPHPRRDLRAPVVAAFLLMLAAMVVRSRPDTWNPGHLIFGDRYFYVPRVLLLWLLVWEFDAAPRAVAWCARWAFAACALVHLKGYILPAPPDYHWREQCEPIRRGVPAKIPTLPEGWTLEYRGRPAPVQRP